MPSLHRSTSQTFRGDSKKASDAYARNQRLTVNAELAGRVTFEAPKSAPSFQPPAPTKSHSAPAVPLLPIAQRNSAARGKMVSADKARQQQTSHMLKTGRRGNPFCKDTHDLFATLMVSLELKNNTRFFRTYANSFTTDDAASNLASLRFSQSNRTADPNDPSRIITTTTTTTFSMSRDIAKGICQHYMDARLVENATDPTSLVFKDRGIFQITPKGLHVLERFISKNGIAADNLVRVFVSQPICMKLVYLDRHPTDDDIIISKTIIETVFKRFAGGRHPNYIIPPAEANRLIQPRPFIDGASPPPRFDRSSGVELQDVSEKTKSGQMTLTPLVFSSQSAVDWLLDFTTCVCRDEAAEILGHFVRMGYIVMHMDRSRSGDKLVIVEVKSDSVGATGGLAHAEFRWGTRVTYRLTDEGKRIAKGPLVARVDNGASPQMMPKLSSDGSMDDDASSTRSGSIHHKPSGNKPKNNNNGMGMGSAMSDAVDSHFLISRQLRDLFNSSDLTEPGNWAKEQHSSTNRLRAILEEPALRALFREYLRSNYCDENLGFWLDVSEFRRRFSTTSSASGGGNEKQKSGTKAAAAASSAMEVHQQHLVSAAMQIYNNYLAPMSQNELNIDHNLRGDVVSFIQKAQLDNAADGSSKKLPVQSPSTDEKSDPTSDIPSIALRATQVQTLLRHYEKIQDHIFRLLATDQVPKFIRTPKFVALLTEDEVAPTSDKRPKPAKSSSSFSST